MFFTPVSLRQRQFLSCLLTFVLLALQTVIPGLVSHAATEPFLLDEQNHLITVNATGDVTTNVNKALEFLRTRPDQSTHWTLKFEGGRYYFKKMLFADRLNNVDLVSDRSNPAILIKSPGFASEYLFYSRFSSRVKLSGFQFYGLTTFSTNSNPVWSEQGVYFGSSNNIVIDKNRFHNFGNAALRVTTSESDTSKGVNSYNITTSNNYFQNVYQITTTSNDELHGATNNYLFVNNNIVNLRGSVKFASRTPARNVKVLYNYIRTSARDGFEVSSYSDLELTGNYMDNIANYAMNIYTNDRATPGYNWGDNLTIKDNTIVNTLAGMRLSFAPYSDGYRPVPSNVKIEGNTMNGVRHTSLPAISVSNGKINGLTISRNKLSKIASRKSFNISPECNPLVMEFNTIDGQTYVATR